METKSLLLSLLIGILISPSVLSAHGNFHGFNQKLEIQYSIILSTDEANLVNGMIGLFESFEAAELKLDSFELDTSSTFQDLLIFLDENLVDTARVDSLGTLIGNAASNLSNSITDERIAGLIFIATDMYFEGISSISNYMSLNSYSNSDIQEIGNLLLNYQSTTYVGMPPCNDLFMAELAGIVATYAACVIGTGGWGAALCGVGSGILVWRAALGQCACLCGRYGTVPSGCGSCP